MAENKSRSGMIFGGLGAALQVLGTEKSAAAALGAFRQFTREYYAPNKQPWQVDGARWGATYASLLKPESSVEYAIAVNAIAREIGCSDYVVEMLATDTSQDPKPVTDRAHPFLRLLEMPNPLHTWQSFMETSEMMLESQGNCYWLLDPLNYLGQPLCVYVLRADRTQPIRSNEQQRAVNPLQLVQAYRHIAEDGHEYYFPPDRVIHIKLPNTLSDYVGMSKTNYLASALELDVHSMESNLNLFKNGGRLGYVIEGMRDDPVKQKEMADKIREAHMGSQNAYKLLFLTGEAKLAAGAKQGDAEMDYVKSRIDISRMIGGMLGVPPLKMGQMEQINRATAIVERQEFLTNAVWPEMKRFVPALNILGRKFHPLLNFRFPMAQVMDPEIMAVLVKNAGEAAAASPNDIREKFLQWPRDRNPRMDEHFLQGINASIEQGGGIPTPPAAGEPGAAGAPKPGELPHPEEDVERDPPVDPHEPPNGPPAKLKPPRPLKGTKAVGAADATGRPFPKGTARQRAMLKALQEARPAIEAKIAPVFEGHFRAVAATMIRELEKRGPSGRAVGRKSVPEFVQGILRAYDTTGTSQGLATAAHATYAAQLAPVAATAANVFEVSMADFKPDTAEAANILAQLGQRITGVDQAVRDQVGALIQQGADLGLSPWQIANGTTPAWSEANGGVEFAGVRNAVDGIAQERAMLIARTETVHLQDAVNKSAFEKMGVGTCDVLGCEDFVIMPGEKYGCNSLLVPVSALPVNFHPNHQGALVPHLGEE